MNRDKQYLKVRGFTLIEVLAAAALAGIGIAGCMGALGSIQHAEAIGREREALMNLATEKYDEIVATTDLTQANSLSGDFTDRNDNVHTWVASTSTVNTSSNSGVTNTATATASTTVDSLSVTVHSNTDSKVAYTVTGLVYVPPTTATTAAPGAPAG
ncbi:MAG: prepilin-type N-terminal cleavage/methylation domain-containing protein [Fimbriimonadaceae bacterium]